MKDKNCERLLEYISYFEDDSVQFCEWQGGGISDDGSLEMSYPQYDDKLLKFINAVYESGIMRQDYMELLENKIDLNNNLDAVIVSSDLQTLQAVLTYFVRQERFCDGAWAAAAEDKIFLKILKRFRYF